ncbi:MAG: hypothetical protein H6834_05320 [Planctomycetes bacterium]|nr:hypothetical protein [Planctomycetota bacterium]
MAAKCVRSLSPLLCGAGVIHADGAGNATQVVTAPATLTGLSFHQFLPISLSGTQVVLTATNGIRIECVR